MATYEFNDKIKFILPAGFHISEGEDDEGNEVVNIVAGEYEDDEGETQHKFGCAVSYSEYDPEEVDEAFTSETLLDWIAEQRKEPRRMKLPGTPKTMLFEQSLCISFANINIIEMSTLLGLVQVSDWSVLWLATVETLEYSQQENSERYEYFYELLKAIRINEKKLPIDSTSPSQIEAALQFASDEDDEEYLTRVMPDEELYPHYNNVLSAGGFGFLGASVVVNNSGTEYEFIPFRRAAENDEVKEDRRALYNRVIAKDTESYNLYEKAKEMQKLFHVNESAFDSRHDRECELEEGYMHKAYMMSGLRSFAWTLADNCKRHDCTPEDIDYTVASGIANFVADEDWLNYDGDSYCQGLCSGSDLHVFFVPDGVAQADKEKLLPSKEDKDRVKKMKEQLPSYREILTEVHSLNALRKDLAYIYPAVKTLWDSLKEDRNYDEALLGNEADIVYAWCALALAAKEPFFTEDGPMSCFFSHPDDEAALQACWEAEESAPTSDDGKTIIFKEGQVAEEDCYIDSSNIFQNYTGSEKDIILPEGISAIGEMAFWKKTDITSVVLPNSLRKIGDSAFYKCEQLTKIVIPEGVETIENEAFYECHNLKTVVLPNSLRKIGDSAFWECEQLTMIIIPEGCEKIGADAFGSCKNLKDIFVPSSVYEFGEDAFDFETIIHTKRDSVADRFLKENYISVDYNGTLKHYTGSGTEIILPDGFSTIGKYLFRNNFNITSVLIPEGFETIENNVFFGCHNLKTVVLPSSLRTIGDSAFWECEQLTKIVIPDGCEKIGAKAFLKCTKLKDIYVPSSVYEIGDAAFDTGNYATIIHTQRGSAAERFAKEHNLKVDYESVPTSDDDILPEKTVPPEKTEKVQISKNDCNIDSSGTFQKYIGSEKDIILPDGISTIGKIAFSNNFDITSVVIPEGVEIIEDGAFKECHDLETVVLPNSLREISENVFFECHNLRTIILPDSLRKIGVSAFYECEQLTRLVVPEGVEIIESAAFGSCLNLKTVVLPNSLRKIGEDAFLACEQLTRIVIPEGIEIVEDYVFNGCHNLKTVVLPDSLREIGECAFCDCKQLTMIIIPEGCKKIGAEAFSCCTNLKDIYVPSSVCEIGEDAFKTICGETIIHTQKGSAAESFAKEHNLKVDYEPVPTEEEEPVEEAMPVEEAVPVPVEASKAEEEPASKEAPALVKSPSLADTSKSPKILIKLFVILILLIVGIFVGTEVIHKVQYKTAEDYYNSGKYEEAIDFIDKSGQKDTEEMADLYYECFYKLVENYMDSGEYLKALRCINSIETDFNNTENENRYAQLEETCYEKLGQEAYDNKAYKTALDYYNQSANGAPEQFYYDYGLYLMSTKDYLAAIEMFEKCPSYNDSLDLIKECKYEYAKAHYTCNATTEAFLRELAGINYKDSKSLHDAMFKWKMELVINNSEDDTSFAQSSTSPYSPIYVHYKVTNGPLNSSVTATIKWTTPTDSGTDSVTLSVGDTGWYGWTKGLYQRGYGASGTLTVTYCDDAGNVMGSASIEIKN